MNEISKIMGKASLEAFCNDGWNMANTDGRKQAIAEAEAAIKALTDAGYAIVPKEPTNSMLNAAGGAMSPGKRPTQRRVSVKKKHAIRYRAMIAAASLQRANETED